jgi:predicted nucleic acid-binding protein
MRVDEVLFLDTNILLGATDESRPHHLLASRLLAASGSFGRRCALSGQIIREYLVVATRSVEANGLGLSADDALANIEQLAERLEFCEETQAVSTRLRSLVRAHRWTGKKIHDANVVATMEAHGITRLVTENPDDFEAYRNITVISLSQATLEESSTS